MATLTVVYHSGSGHTRIQAEAVHRGAAGVSGIDAELLTVEEATERLDDLDNSDAIIFGSPTYMGSMSATMKGFFEDLVKVWFGQRWKNKIAGAFTNSSSFSGDKLNTLIGMVIHAMQQGMIYVGTGMLPAVNSPESMNTNNGPGPDALNRVGSSTGPMASSFQVDPPEAPAPGDVETAVEYGRRVAEITLQFERGRQG